LVRETPTQPQRQPHSNSNKSTRIKRTEADPSDERKNQASIDTTLGYLNAPD
jgi:hypothetical protein